MINILYISWTDKMSGGEISLINYASLLDRKIFRPVFLFPKQGKASTRASEKGIETRFIDMGIFSFKRPWRFIRSVMALRKLLKKEKIDIIHCTTFYSNLIAVAAAKTMGIPIICHGQSYLTTGSRMRNAVSMSDLVIVCSEDLKKSLLPHIKSSRIKVMHHAVSTPALRKKTFFLHKELGLPKKCALVGHVGLIEPRKRQEDLIKAASLVRNKNARFLIIGDSQFEIKSYEDSLHKLAESYGIDKKVIFLGFREDISKVMNELDIVVLPSVKEPFALVMIEAMALGKPFIGARSGGTTEFIRHGKNGFLIDPGDYRSLASIINMLLSNPSRSRKIGIEGRRSVEEKCDISDFVRRLSNIYLTISHK